MGCTLKRSGSWQVGLGGHSKGDMFLRTGRMQTPHGLVSGALDAKLAEQLGSEGGAQWHQAELEARHQQ